MAKRNYLVEGLSGAGKSSVYEELIQRGYRAISTDRAWKTRESLWNPEKALGELERPDPDVLFVCGGGGNRDRFLSYFTKVFNLRIDDDTMRRRLAERTNNDYGKDADELALMLRLNQEGAKPAGAIDIDATRPLDEVVEEVLRLADCEAAASEPPPWSRRGSAVAVSVVGRTRIEYSWSGDVLVTLLSYLGEQGIDLADEVLTSEHRDRYLPRLDPSTYDGAVLGRYYEEVFETTADGVGYAMLDGIAFLRDTLEAIEPGVVAVLAIG